MHPAAPRYAQALFHFAKDNNNLDTVVRDMQELQIVAQESLEFQRVIDNPTIRTDDKQMLLSRLFVDKTQKETLTFLSFLAKQERLDILEDICIALDQLYKKEKGILDVFVTSSMALNQEQLELLDNHLKDKFQKNIKLSCSIDKSLIGGIRIQIDDRVYDYSIQTQLDIFRNKLLHS